MMQQDDQVGELSITLQEVIDIINNDLQEELGGVKSQEESEGVNDLQ